MAFLMFTEGKNNIGSNGLPATCTFDLSTKTTAELTAAATYGGGYSVATGTGYAAKTQSEPSPSSAKFQFTEMEWKTETATNWPSGIKCLVLRNGTTALLMAWDFSETLNMAGEKRILKATPSWTQG